jgi:hypothetical protein
MPTFAGHRTIVVGRYHELCSSGAATNKVHSSRSGCGNVMLSKVRSVNWHALAAYAAAVRWPAENGAARTVASLKWNAKSFYRHCLQH